MRCKVQEGFEISPCKKFKKKSFFIVLYDDTQYMLRTPQIPYNNFCQSPDDFLRDMGHFSVLIQTTRPQHLICLKSIQQINLTS